MHQRDSVSESLKHYANPKHDVVEFADSIKDGGTRVSRGLRLFYIFDHASLKQPGDLPTQRWLHSIPRKRPYKNNQFRVVQKRLI